MLCFKLALKYFIIRDEVFGRANWLWYSNNLLKEHELDPRSKLDLFTGLALMFVREHGHPSFERISILSSNEVIFLWSRTSRPLSKLNLSIPSPYPYILTCTN